MELVSIIMPVFNSEKYLKKSIDSILNQTYLKLELIVVDDGSTDFSKDIILKYCKIDTRVKYIENLNKGVSNSRNTGIRLAKGEYIAFIDSDDYMEMNAIEEMVNYIELNDSDVCMAGYIEETVKKNRLISLEWKDGTNFNNYEIRNKIIPRMIAIKKEEKNKSLIMGSVWRLLIKKEILKKNNIKFNPEIYLSEDLLFCIELFARTKSLIITKKCFYHYVRYGNTTLERYRENFVEENILFYEEYEKKLRCLDLFDENKERFYISKNNFYTKAISNLYRYDSPKVYEKKIKQIKQIMDIYNEDRAFNGKFIIKESLSKRVALILLRTRMIKLLHISFTIKEKMRRRLKNNIK